MSKSISKLIYRSILRWARENKDIPFSLRSVDVYEILPRLRTTSSILSFQDNGASSVLDMARSAFRENQFLSDPRDIDHAIDKGLEALRTLNSSYASLLEEMKKTRADREQRLGIEYKIGTVFIHKKFGYRGIIYGWDRKCDRDSSWIQQFNAKPDEPHYYVLPDEADCVRLLGGHRLTKYVGQSNIVPLHGVRILHRALDYHFIGFSEKKGRYIPVKRIQYEYPDDYNYCDEDLTCASEDANLLREGDKKESSLENDGDSDDGVPPQTILVV